MKTSVRRAGAADTTALAKVAAATFALACPPHTTDVAKAAFIRDVLSEERFAGYLSDSARMLFLAEHEDDARGAREAVGYTMLNLTEPTDTDVASALSLHPAVELSKCYVIPGQHGTGVASALMQASLDAAVATGAAEVWLGVNEENARAQRFYAKHGFERVGTKHFLVGDRLEDDFVFERAL